MDRRLWCTLENVRVPSLFSFLDDKYESFLVTPGPLKWYFPRAFLMNTGLKETRDYSTIQIRNPRSAPRRALNELDVTDFFINRLKQAKPPFAAVYYSYAPHYDYMDYGEEVRIFPDTSSRLYRYLNNLRMIDEQIKRIYRVFEERKLVENTLIVITSDHSELSREFKRAAGDCAAGHIGTAGGAANNQPCGYTPDDAGFAGTAL